MEIIVIDEDDLGWKAHKDFILGRAIQINSHVTEDKLFLLGASDFSTISKNPSDPNTPGTLNMYVKNPPYPLGIKFPLSDDYYITFNNDNGLIGFIPTNNPVTSGTSRGYLMPQIDSSFY